MSALLSSHRDGVLTLTLNRPEKLNAFDAALTAALRDALQAAAADPAVRAVILTGAGRGFSAGQDLDELVDADSGRTLSVDRHLREGFNPIVLAIRSMEKPVIAAVGGVAAGIGLSIALCCDLRVASDDAKLTVGFSRIGLIPDGGATLMLPLLAGFSRALELAWTSDVVGAEEALRLGLVNHVVPAAELATRAAGLARKLTGMPAAAVGMTKRAFNAACCPDLAAVLEREAALQGQAAALPDLMTQVHAFRERRARKG